MLDGKCRAASSVQQSRILLDIAGVVDNLVRLAYRFSKAAKRIDIVRMDAWTESVRALVPDE